MFFDRMYISNHTLYITCLASDMDVIKKGIHPFAQIIKKEFLHKYTYLDLEFSDREPVSSRSFVYFPVDTTYYTDPLTLPTLACVIL